MAERIAIAGASGFVGRELVRALEPRGNVVALSRGAPEEGARGPVEWRRCNLFSLRACEAALEGIDVAYYLVHSMLPTTRLTQAGFEELDLLLADNFGRAAARNGVKRIIYLGGLVPHDEPPEKLSPHLRSRLEVEGALGAHGVPVTAVRAGLVVGPGGGSLEILVRLVERLPVMICPSWTGSLTQPIAQRDVVAILVHCADDPETTGRICEVGGPDVMSYRDLMRETARVLRRRRLFLPVPLFTPQLSRLWVTLVTRQPKALVAPLVRSLAHPMVAHDQWLQERMGLPGQPFAEALAEAASVGALGKEPAVRSIQRLPHPPGMDAIDIAEEYARWLPRALRPFILVDREGDVLRFRLRGVERAMLELTWRPERSGPDRAVLEVTGGLLVGERVGMPRMEYRTLPGGDEVLVAVQDFRPRIPWWLYTLTQARLHLWIMRAFARHLTKGTLLTS